MTRKSTTKKDTQMAIPERVAQLPNLPIQNGGHGRFEDGHCAMELVSWLANEPFSAAPACACPVITSFVVAWNDGLPNDEARARLLGPFLPRIVGSRSDNPKVAEQRILLALDWFIRVYTPAFVRLVPALADHAQRLVDLDEITLANAIEAGPIVPAGSAAGAAAWAAAGAAAWNAAGDAAWAAVWDAAGAAAWAAVWDAAGDAAGDTAWAAARDAAWAAAEAAAGAAAWNAAGAALEATVTELQASAADLLNRMLMA